MTIGYAKLTAGIIIEIEVKDSDIIHQNDFITKNKNYNLGFATYTTNNFKLKSIEYVNGDKIDNYNYSYTYKGKRDDIAINKSNLPEHLKYVNFCYIYGYHQINFNIDEEYDEIIEFFLTKEAAFYKNSTAFAEWKFFINGYSGAYKEFDINGNLIYECFHINGKRLCNSEKYYSFQEFKEPSIINGINVYSFGFYPIIDYLS